MYVHRCGAYTEHPITPFPALQTRNPSAATKARRFDTALPAHHAVTARANTYFSRHWRVGVRRGRWYRGCPRCVGLRWVPDRHLRARRARSRKGCFGTGPQWARCGRALPPALVGRGSYGETVGRGCRCGRVEGERRAAWGVLGGWRARCVLPLMPQATTWKGKVLHWRT